MAQASIAVRLCGTEQPDVESRTPAGERHRSYKPRDYAYSIVSQTCADRLREEYFSVLVKEGEPGYIHHEKAAEVIAKGGEALNPRGERYSPDTIRGVLAMRDFMDTMRSSGVVGGGPPPLTQANRNAFAAQLDTWLARQAPVLQAK